jgi:thiol-disulfide isomerase/thioredoxin
VRVTSCVGLLALLLALGGCTSAQKKPAKAAPPANARAGDSTPFWANNSNRQPGAASVPGVGGNIDPVSAPGNDPEISGILAGRVMDSFGRPPAAAFIQVNLVQTDGKTESIADVETVNQGCFYIRGLQPRRTYRLVARSTRDGRTIAGETQAQPPETRLVITLSEDFVTSATPAVPGPPKGLRPLSNSQSSVRNPQPASPAPDAPWNNGDSSNGGGPEFAPVVPIRPEQVAGVDLARTPSANVPPPGLSSIVPSGPAFTPAVLVSANRIQYLALPDVDGRPWDLTQRRGRLLLIDLWGTWCGPCLQAIPELIRLQSTYGPRGLEVIGIACEKGAPADSVRRVKDIRGKLGVNYRLLLGDDGAHQPVEHQFAITAYPTLVLVDVDGAIIWRGEGTGRIGDLEQILKRRLAY